MSIAQFLDELRAQQIHLWVEDGKLRYTAPAGRLTPELRQELLERKAELLSALAPAAAAELPQAIESPPGAAPDPALQSAPSSQRVNRPLPPSYAQQRLWLFQQFDPTGSVYNVTQAFHLHGSLDLQALRRSLDEIVRRHESLRTTLEFQDGELVQIIHDQLPGGELLEYNDLTGDAASALSAAERQAEAGRLQVASGNQPFDLQRGPLLRAFLARLDQREHILRITIHHAATDGWSMSIFLSELSRLYAAFSQGLPSPLPELPLQYAGYTAWQRDFLSGPAWQAQDAYWRRQLSGEIQPLPLPLDAPRPGLQIFAGERIEYDLPEALSMALRQLSRSSQVTLFMLLLAAFDVLLYRYSGQTDILVGSPIANRRRKEFEQLIGFFANTLVLRTDLSGTPSFNELLKRVRETALQAYDHQDMPFEQLVQNLELQRDLSRNPLFQVSFALQNMPVEPLALAGIQVERLPMDKDSTPFDWTVLVWDDQRALRVHWAYNAGLFSRERMQSAIANFQTLLELIVTQPDLPIDRLNLVNEADRRSEIVAWNATQHPYPRELPLAQLFEAQVEKTPSAPALLFSQEEWTYAGLNQYANRLAHSLRALGVQPGDLVGVCLERSARMVAAFLAILKAGAAYLPLDPGYPNERLAFMLDDSAVRACLSQASLAGSLRVGDMPLLLLDSQAGEIDRQPGENLQAGRYVPGESLAYVMYTSGSTGAPKGICIPQSAVARLVLNSDYVRLAPGDRVAQASNASFDAATFEIWGALLNGACLVGVSQEVALSPEGLAKLIREQRITSMFLTTALFNQIAAIHPQAFQPLRELLFGGEAVAPAWVRAVLQAGPPQRLLHVYGPTESTTFATWRQVTDVPEGAQTIPIGWPIANTSAYVLDAHMQPVPLGVPGELYLGGDGLATGYLNRPELSAEKFLPNPFAAGRLYRTGDLVRRTPDGEIEFIRRIDQQVKLRGFRIELGEIEAALEACSGVSQAVVLLREDQPGEKRLAAYLLRQPGAPFEPAELRTQLKLRLPEYMLPAAYVLLEAFPVTPNGKVDRRALPAPASERQEAPQSLSGPRDALESALCQAWEGVLQVHPVGIHDNFFELGGHSLLAVRLLEQIAREHGRRLPLVSLFEAPTVAQQAALLRLEQQREAVRALVPIQPQGQQAPFYFLPNFGGGLFNLAPLANALGLERPFYSFQPRGLDGNEAPHDSLPEMASYYLQALRSFQPNGPYLLGGFCFGGVVAYEMARQLEAQGERAALVAIVDGYAPRQAVHGRSLRRAWIFLRNFPHWLGDFWSLGPREMWVNIHRRLRMLGKRLAGRFGKQEQVQAADLVIHQPPDTPDSYQKLMVAHMQAILDYEPGKYGGALAILRVQRMPLLAQYDPDLGWGRLTRGEVKVSYLPGGHHNMLEPPYVYELAAQLKRVLEAAG